MGNHILVQGFVILQEDRVLKGDPYYLFSGIFAASIASDGTMTLLDAVHSGYGLCFREVDFSC